MKISDLRKIGSELGRVGMSEMALDCVKSFDGSYKGVMKLCGELSVIAKMSTCDQYWEEQVLRGKYKINEVCEFKLEKIKEVI